MTEGGTEAGLLVDVPGSAGVGRDPRHVELGGSRGHLHLGGEQLRRHLLKFSRPQIRPFHFFSF